MPDEFRLRPFVTIEEAGAGPNCIALDAKSAYAFTITSREHPHDIGLANAAHEQGARALAAALLEVYEMREREFMERRTDKSIVAAGETRRCIHDIHRLVPPGGGKVPTAPPSASQSLSASH